MHSASSTFEQLLSEIARISSQLPNSTSVHADLERIRDLAKAARKIHRATESAISLLGTSPPETPEAVPTEPEKAVELPIPVLVATVVGQPEPPKPVEPEAPVVTVTAVFEAPPAEQIIAPAKPKPTAVRRFEVDLKKLIARHNLLREPTHPRGTYALKALVAAGRSLKERGSLEVFDLSKIEPELDAILDLYHQDDGSEYFGANLARQMSADAWDAFDRAYQALDLADVALREFDAMDDESLRQVPEPITDDLAACVMGVVHVIAFYGISVNERMVQPLKEHLKELFPERFMRALITKGDEALLFKDIQERWENFTRDFPVWNQKRKNREQRDAAKASFDRLLKSIESLDNQDRYADDIVEAVQFCLDSGTPASDKNLLQHLLPFRALFENCQNGKLKALKTNLDKQFVTLSSKVALKDPAETTVEDPEHLSRVEALKTLLQDKVLVLIGGNKGQGWRKDELAKLLGLKEVQWPDLEDTSNLNSVRPDVLRADVVAQLIRWSRHSYGELLSFAKDNGKPIVRVTGGLGTKRIVHDLHQQLVLKTG
jgi:hypothetical protein